MKASSKWKFVNSIAAIFIILIIWLIMLFTYSSKKNISVELDETEKNWIAAHPEIKLAPDPHFAPIEYFDNNIYKGLIADYFKLIGERINLKIIIVKMPSWEDVLKAAQSREIDGITAAQITPDRLKYLSFSDVIIDIPNVIIARQDLQPPVSLNDLKSMKIAITKGNALHEHLESFYPEIIIEPVIDDLAALNLVSFKQADATIVNLAIASHLIEEHGITNLHIIGDSGKTNPLAIAVRNDYKILKNILNKALNSISEAERIAINERWIKLKIDRFMLSKDFWVASSISLTCAIIIFLIIIIWNYRLIKQIEKKTAELDNELTERRKSEQALKKSEEQYRAIIELAVDAILLGSPEGFIISANSKACELTGYPADELIGKKITMLFRKETLTSVPLRFDLLKKGEIVRIQRNMLRKDGSEIIVDMNTKMMPDFTYQSFIRDITEQKKTELHLKDINSKLLNAIDELKSLDEMKINILSNVSHELRTPLVSVRGYIELMAAEKFGAVNDTQKNYLHKILSSVDRLVKIIEDLIMFSRIEKGKENINYSQFNIMELLKDCVSVVYPKILEKNINTVILDKENSILINADKDKLAQVIINILMNAVKFTDKNGSINLSAVLENNGNIINIDIKDSGIGIPENKINKIFERFYQIDSSMTRQYGGLGLGLSICKNIIEMHKGKISAKNNPEGGALFSIALPVKKINF